MIRKLKMGGSALLMALVVQALLAAGAGAEFKSSSSHPILETQGTRHIFTAAPGVGWISCETGWVATLSSSVSADLTISPGYALCFDAFGRMIDVSTTTPHQQTLTTDSLHRLGHTTYTVTSSNTPVCVITVGPQTNNGISFNNLGGTKGTEVVTNTTNIVSTITGGLFNCGVKNGEYKEGTYTGTTVVTAKDTAGNPVEFNKLP